MLIADSFARQCDQSYHDPLPQREGPKQMVPTNHVWFADLLTRLLPQKPILRLSETKDKNIYLVQSYFHLTSFAGKQTLRFLKIGVGKRFEVPCPKRRSASFRGKVAKNRSDIQFGDARGDIIVVRERANWSASTTLVLKCTESWKTE